MEKEDRERMVRVEVGVDALIETIKEHIKADCAALGRAMHRKICSPDYVRTVVYR